MKNSFFPSFLMLLLLGMPVFAEKTASLENARIVLELAPGENNPRNSEGDFIRLKNNDILLAYSHYTGQSAGDHEPAHIAGRISKDEGETWSEPFFLREVEEGGLNLMSVSLLRLQDGRIALFYLRKYTLQDTRPFVCFSMDEGKTWTNPQACISEAEKGYYVVNNARVIQLSDGVILIPCAHHPVDANGRLTMAATMVCYFSTDAAQTFQRGGEVENPENVICQEPGLLEMADGTLLMIIRTNAGSQYLSRSRNGGRTWTPAEKSSFISPLSPAQLSKFPNSDKILAVWNESPSERNPLTLAVLNQNLECVTKWIIDESEPSPARWFCYPALFPLSNGDFLLGYCAGAKRLWGLDTLRVKKFHLTVE